MNSPNQYDQSLLVVTISPSESDPAIRMTAANERP